MLFILLHTVCLKILRKKFVVQVNGFIQQRNDIVYIFTVIIFFRASVIAVIVEK